MDENPVPNVVEADNPGSDAESAAITLRSVGDQIAALKICLAGVTSSNWPSPAACRGLADILMCIEDNVASARETFEAMGRETEGVSGCSKGEGTFMEQALAGHPSGM